MTKLDPVKRDLWRGLDADTWPDLTSLALVTIDMQRDTLDGGALEIAGTSAVLPRLARLASTFRTHGLPIVHVVRLYEADGSNVEPCRRPLIKHGVPLLRPETDGSEIAEALLPSPHIHLEPRLLLSGGIQQLSCEEVAIYKPRWGAFYSTPVEEHLRSLGVTSLAFAGCNFPNCPRTSIYEASERDFRIVVLEDAVSGLYARGRDELRSIGVALLTCEELIRAIDVVSLSVSSKQPQQD